MKSKRKPPTPSEPELSPRRQALKAEAERVAALIAREKPLEPNERVLSLMASARRQHQKAEMAVSKYAREDHRTAAKEFEIRAQKAWEEQIAEHQAATADAEVVTLSRIDGGQFPRLRSTETAVADWVRDQHGAIVKEEGLPMLRTEIAVARRRTSGLEHVAMKAVDGRPRLAPRLLEVGVWYGHVCADAAAAGLTGREEIGLPAQITCKPSTGPADWKIEAVREKFKADRIFRVAFGSIEGARMIRLLEAICYEGVTPRAFAMGDEREGIRIEERLIVGLEMLAARRKALSRSKERVA